VGNVTVEVVDPPRKQMSTGRPRIDESSRKKSRDKQNAIATAVVGLLQSPYCQEIVGKSGGVDDVTSPWEDLLEGSRDTALSQLATARIGTCFAIMHCINNSDIMNPSNFEPAILKKVGKHTFEVLDVHQRDKVEDDLEMNGNKEDDNGLRDTFGLYYKSPTDSDIQSYHANAAIARGIEAHTTDQLDFSPKRQSLCGIAADNVRKKATVVKERALKKSTSSVFKEGDVVLVPLDDVDRTKVDGASICRVICQIKNDMCTVAVKEGVLWKSYVYHWLGGVPEASKDCALMELDEAYLGWRGMPKITEREAAKYVSSVGGQGMVKCHCKGDCTTYHCDCKKADRLCNSCCHRNNYCCKNGKDANESEEALKKRKGTGSTTTGNDGTTNGK
jgi:hypothetical protein